MELTRLCCQPLFRVVDEASLLFRSVIQEMPSKSLTLLFVFGRILPDFSSFMPDHVAHSAAETLTGGATSWKKQRATGRRRQGCGAAT